MCTTIFLRWQVKRIIKTITRCATMKKDEQQTITFIQGDLTNSNQVREVFEEQCITHVIHLVLNGKLFLDKK